MPISAGDEDKRHTQFKKDEFKKDFKSLPDGAPMHRSGLIDPVPGGISLGTALAAAFTNSAAAMAASCAAASACHGSGAP